MPLDGTDLFEDPSLTKLARVERLLATEQHWCKGRLRDADGRRCLVDAIAAVDGRLELTRPIVRAAREVSGKRFWRIESFNDDPRTTHQDVLRVLHRARENMLTDMVAAREPRSWRGKCVHALRNFLPAEPPASGAAFSPIGANGQSGGGATETVARGQGDLRSSVRETTEARW